MQIISNFFYFISIYYLLGIINCSPIKPKKQNQLNAFPNTVQPPTKSDDIKKYEYLPPLLSKSLYELDPTMKITKQKFLKIIKYAEYQLTQGELEQIFVFADTNHNDLLDMNEWENFATLFILPYEACLQYNDKLNKSTQDYLLTVEKYKTCFDSDPKSKFIKFRRRNEQNKYITIFETISTRGLNKINFYEYFFIKKVMFAWTQCQSHYEFMGESHFYCGIKLAVPNKYLMKISLKKIYHTGLAFQSTNFSLIQLDFIAFLRIAYYTHYFTILGLPQEIPFIERTEFLKAIKENRLPINFEESEVEIFFELTNTNLNNPLHSRNVINFESFCFFFHMHRLFNKYSIQKPMLLHKSELLKLLKDNLTPIKTVLSIDSSFTNFGEPQYQEASLILQKKRVNENNFFYSFRQDASETIRSMTLNSTVNSSYYHERSDNYTNREIFFSIFADRDRNYWTKKNYYRAFQLANLYVGLEELVNADFDKRPFISQIPSRIITEKIQHVYETVNPPISQIQRRNFAFYKVFPREVNIDLLVFLSVENFPFRIATGLKFPTTIIETNLKMILQDMGMKNMPDTVLDVARKGSDHLRRRVFNTHKTAENVLLVQAVASELMRNKNNYEKHKLRNNSDLSRLYPRSGRRFISSPLV